jgi:hypothetical protein
VPDRCDDALGVREMNTGCLHRAPRAALGASLLLGLFAAGCGAERATDASAADVQPDGRPGDPLDAMITCEDGGVCEGTDPSETDDAGFDEDAQGPLDAEPGLDGARGDAALDGARRDATVDAGRADGGAMFLPLPTCANVNSRLREDFGVVIQPGTISFEGLPSEDISCEQRILVYRMFALPHQYERFPQRVNVRDAYTIHLYRGSSAPGACSAYVPSGQAILVRDLRSCMSSVSSATDPDFIRIAMLLIHETGHIITSRVPSLRTAFERAGLPALDPRCYDRGFIKTYSLRTTNPVNESFAEAAALFIGRRKVGSLATIQNFAVECPNTHAWIESNLFGARR